MPTLSRSEQEIPIARCAEEDPWTIYGADLAELPSSMSLADRVGGRMVRHQGGTKILLPQDSVFLQRRRKLHLTPEQRTGFPIVITKFGSVPITGTKIIQHHKASGGTRKLSNSSMVHTWSVSPVAMAGVTGFHCFREPFRPLVGRLWGRRCRKLRWGTTK